MGLLDRAEQSSGQRTLWRDDRVGYGYLDL